jgi:hypothetical protein
MKNKYVYTVLGASLLASVNLASTLSYAGNLDDAKRNLAPILPATPPKASTDTYHSQLSPPTTGQTNPRSIDSIHVPTPRVTPDPYSKRLNPTGSEDVARGIRNYQQPRY